MANINIDALVLDVQKELLSEYRTMTPKSLDYIDDYYQSRLSNEWSIDTAPHYHFWIDTHKKQDRLWIAVSLINHLGGTLGEKTYFQLPEDEFLKDPSVPLQKGKNAFVILTECKDEPLTAEEESAWARAKICLCDPQCPTFFLLASSETMNCRFSDPLSREKYITQLFRYRINTAKHFSAEYYLQELNRYLDTTVPGKRAPSFDAAMTEYLETVIPKSINEGHDFLEDLKKRVKYEYDSNHHPDVIDERCVPHYHKDQPADPESKAPSATTGKAENDTQNQIPDDQLPPLPDSECGTFFKIDPDSAPVTEVKNILLLTLSTSTFRKASVSLSNTPGKDMLTYYYQLEPVPYKLMEQFKQDGTGEKLDGILMICSPQTREDKVAGRKTDCEDFYDTPENYFIYKTSRYAQSCGYQLSYKEIRTNIGLSDEHSMKPEQRAKDTKKLIYKVIEEIRTLKKHYPNLNIHVDTHGGFRTSQEILNSALSLLQMEGIPIDPENIHAVDFISQESIKKNKEIPTTFFTSAKDTFDIMNFVSGIHECINYGQIKSLHMLQNTNPAEQEVQEHMQNIAEGIQLCDVDKFEKGLQSLSQALPKLNANENVIENAGYLTLFQGLIRDSYGERLLDNQHRRVVDEIKWCTEKGFIQQALTLLESKMPREILKNGLLVSKAQDDARSIFDAASGNRALSNDFIQYLNHPNSPKFRWESAENYIVQIVGYTKRSAFNVPFIPIREDINYDALNTFESDPVITIRNPKNTNFPVRKYCIAENPQAGREINILLRLHMQLKDERNKTNHAGNDKKRFSLTAISHALEAYVELYEKIIVKLNP